MAGKDTTPPEVSGTNNGSRETSGPVLLWTREIIKENFKRTSNITTIQVHDTILFKDTHRDRGARPFINLVAALVRNKRRNTEPFAAVWLVTDTAQLKHVIGATKARAKSVFDTLALHATVAVIEPWSEHLPMLSRTLPTVDQGKQRVLTGFPSNSGSGYDYYGHFAPPAGQGWRKGPCCMLIRNVPRELDDLLEKLRAAHAEYLGQRGGPAVKSLEKSGISILSLDQLIQ